jgi:hypothetical protein
MITAVAAFVMRPNWARLPWRATACSNRASADDYGAFSLNAGLFGNPKAITPRISCA